MKFSFRSRILPSLSSPRLPADDDDDVRGVDGCVVVVVAAVFGTIASVVVVASDDGNENADIAGLGAAAAAGGPNENEGLAGAAAGDDDVVELEANATLANGLFGLAGGPDDDAETRLVEANGLAEGAEEGGREDCAVEGGADGLGAPTPNFRLYGKYMIRADILCTMMVF